MPEKDITIKQEFEFLTNKRSEFGKGILVFSKGEQVMICESSVRNNFKKHYTYKVVKKWKSCELVIIE